MYDEILSSRLANKQDKMNALLGNELIEILSLEKLVNESRSLCHIVSVLIENIQYIFLVILRQNKSRCFSFNLLSGAMFSLNGPASLAWQEDSERPSMAAARCLHGLPWAVCSSGSGQKKARGSKTGGKELENWENEQKNQKRTVILPLYWLNFIQGIKPLIPPLRIRSSKSDFRQVHRQEDKERKAKGEGKLQPIRNMLRKVWKAPFLSTKCLKTHTLTEQQSNYKLT